MVADTGYASPSSAQVGQLLAALDAKSRALVQAEQEQARLAAETKHLRAELDALRAATSKTPVAGLVAGRPESCWATSSEPRQALLGGAGSGGGAAARLAQTGGSIAEAEARAETERQAARRLRGVLRKALGALERHADCK